MTDYEKSNKIVEVDFSRLSSKEYYNLINCTDNRKMFAQELVNYLCDKYHINRIPVIVTDKPRKCTKHCQIYGKYHFSGGYGIKITIYNFTAKTGKEVAIKSFTNTLLHEFIHHYDTEYLKIQSAHTSGFYKRINDLEKKLAR